VIGVGRGGAVLSPWLAGALFDPSGVSTTLPVGRLTFVAVVMAMGSLLSAAVLFLLRLNADRTVDQKPIQKPESRARSA